jgi:hypothetical protein
MLMKILAVYRQNGVRPAPNLKTSVWNVQLESEISDVKL